ncbi:hypothetical protein T01_12288, partial [Trichinella spiralis]
LRFAYLLVGWLVKCSAFLNLLIMRRNNASCSRFYVVSLQLPVQHFENTRLRCNYGPVFIEYNNAEFAFADFIYSINLE